MNNFGHQTLVIGQQNVYLTGVGWEYLTVINESPFLLTLSFSGVGSMDFPAWFQGDVPVPREYTGQLSINPINYLGITQLVSQLVTLNGWIHGEITNPQWTSLSQNFGNVVTSTATNLANIGYPITTQVIQVQPAGDSGYDFAVDNLGNVTIGDAAHGGSLSVVGTSTFGGRVQGNGGSNLRLDTGGVGRAIEFDASGVQKGFYDSNGLNINSPINNAMGSPDAAATMTAGLCLSGGLNMYDGAVSGSPHQPGLTLQTNVAAGAGQSIGMFTNNIARMAIFDSAVQIYNQLTANAQINANMPSQATGNGSVSGNATLWTPIWGSGLKIGIAFCLSNFQTATNVTLLFPSALTNGIYGISGPISGTTFSFQNGGVAQNLRRVTSIGAAGGGVGADEAQSVLKNDWLFSGGGSSDRIVIQTTAAANINAMLCFFIGV
jgi:hypothetical protein